MNRPPGLPRIVIFSIAALFWSTLPARASDPLVALSATELRFGTQAQGTSSSPQAVVVTNIGQADLIISSITLSGENSADFVESTTCPSAPAVLPAGRNCEIRVLFHPHSSGPEMTGTLTISDNASGSPRSVAVRGIPTPAAPGITLAPASLGFGNQPVASVSAAHSITLTNSGSVTLNLTSAIALSGADASEFRIAKSANSCPEDSGQLAPRTSCEIDVVFAPVTPGAKNAQLEIMDAAAGSPHVVSLNATAVAPRQ